MVTQKELLEEIVRLIKEAGYNPKDQLFGYYKTGLDSYITRKGGAREMIKNLNKETLLLYIQNQI